MHAPGEAVLFCGGEHFVFLGVIEVLHIQAALLLAERGLRQAALAIVFERAEVVLQAGDQGHMLHAAGGAHGIPGTLRTMAALTRMFSARVAWRDQVVMNTWVGFQIGEGLLQRCGSCKSAASQSRPAPVMAGGTARRPAIVAQAVSWVMALPTMPLAPTTSAVWVINFSEDVGF